MASIALHEVSKRQEFCGFEIFFAKKCKKVLTGILD